MKDPTSPEVRRIFDRITRDPWCPVSIIPHRYRVAEEVVEHAPLALPAAPPQAKPVEPEVIQVAVKEEGKDLLMGDLILRDGQHVAARLPRQRSPLAITAAKENSK